MNETEYLGKQTPGCNFYKPNFSAKSQATRSPNANLNRDKSPKEPLIPYKKDNSPSPFTYKDVDTKWKKMSTYRNTLNHVYTIKKETKTSFLDQTLKHKTKVPQVGHYKDDMSSYLMLSKGTQIPRYKQGR